MVKYFIVVCHPEPKSFCKAMGQTAIDVLRGAGHEVRVTDIYEAGFDPLTSRKNFKSVKDAEFFKPQAEELYAVSNNLEFAEDVEEELKKLEWCDVLLFQFPLYWFALPAGLKGWVDRVFVMGRTYGGKFGFYDGGAFKGKKALLSLTTGGPGPTYTAEGFNGDINGVLRPIHRGIFEFVGFSVLRPQIVYGAAHGSDEDRKAQLAEWSARLPTLHEESPIEVGRYA